MTPSARDRQVGAELRRVLNLPPHLPPMPDPILAALAQARAEERESMKEWCAPPEKYGEALAEMAAERDRAIQEAKSARAEEREACANLCDERARLNDSLVDPRWVDGKDCPAAHRAVESGECAAAIRARGKEGE